MPRPTITASCHCMGAWCMCGLVLSQEYRSRKVDRSWNVQDIAGSTSRRSVLPGCHGSDDMYMTKESDERGHFLRSTDSVGFTIVATNEGITIASSQLAVDIFFCLLQSDVHISVD